MALRPLDLMEPEETVGDIWHGLASGIGAGMSYPDAAAALCGVRQSLSVLFRAISGAGNVEITEAASIRSMHRMSTLRKIGTPGEQVCLPTFDGEVLRLPPEISAFPDPALNRTAYFWLTALAAVAEIPGESSDPLAHDWLQITANDTAFRKASLLCPGLRDSAYRMRKFVSENRLQLKRSHSETLVEDAVSAQLQGRAIPSAPDVAAPSGYRPFYPVPIWLTLTRPGDGGTAQAGQEEAEAPTVAAQTTTRKLGLRKDASEANRRDSFIIHRFEAILSWVESMNLNRSVDDNDDEDAQKAAEDQDSITLSQHDRRAATPLRMHLDLSPSDAEHERLSGVFTYPEWNHRSRSYMPGHCRVLDADTTPDPEMPVIPDSRYKREVRRRFETLLPRRVLRPRQVEGSELDLDAVISSQINLRATGRSSDRIYQDLRQIDRDLSVAILLDTSRSTEAAAGDTSVIDVAREALSALAGGIDAAGDRLGLWGFSSLRRDRVFLHRCKSFDTPFSQDTLARIHTLRPGHYTRLGAAIRHVSAMLDAETAGRKLLIVITDGKPNDLDHYEGQHGIEDSHMAVREARNLGQTVQGIIVDEDGQDWFSRIFGRGGFTLLPHPSRLIRALPDIYQSLTQET